MIRGGYFDVARIKAFPQDDERAERRSIRVHWSVVIGCALAGGWLLAIAPPEGSAIRGALMVWLVQNAVMAAANLLPLPTSDGPAIWLFARQLRAARGQQLVRDLSHAIHD